MTEILKEYTTGLKNYFRNFSKATVYKITKKILLITVLIVFNIISIPCYLCYKYGLYRGIKLCRDKPDKKTPTYLTGIHSKKENEMISISEVNLVNPDKNDKKK